MQRFERLLSVLWNQTGFCCNFRRNSVGCESFKKAMGEMSAKANSNYCYFRHDLICICYDETWPTRSVAVSRVVVVVTGSVSAAAGP